MFQVRELPPLRQSVLVTTPNGNRYRWGGDERRPENVPSGGLSFSSVVPGGFETMEATLPRKVGTAYQDMERLSTLTVLGAGGEILWEGRLEKTPRVSGDEVSISPQAVGWQAHLEDDSSATCVFVDHDLSHWGTVSNQTRLNNAATVTYYDHSVDSDTTTPGIRTGWDTHDDGRLPRSMAVYDAGAGSNIASVYFDKVAEPSSTVTGAGWHSYVGVESAQTIGTGTSSYTADLGAGASLGTFTGGPLRFAILWFDNSVTTGWEDFGAANNVWREVAVFGDHGLTLHGQTPNLGYYASDVIEYAVGRWCPLLSYSSGASGTIKPTLFVVPQLEFREPTTAAEILSQANRFHLNDWAVWEGERSNQPTFYYNERNATGKRWRARVGPSNLQETGPQVDRLFNSAIVSYQDVDGTTKTVGGPLTGTDFPGVDVLRDADPLNPLNQLGIERPAKLDMGITSTSTAAIEVGRRFLERATELDHSGQAELVGHVTDDHGVVFPASRVRAGDQISFTDSADPSYRRIVRTNYDHDSRTNSLDLDSPPEGLADLLEQLGVAMASIPSGSSIGAAAATVPKPDRLSTVGK